MSKTARYFEDGYGAVHKELKRVEYGGDNVSHVVCRPTWIYGETYPSQLAHHWRNVTCKRCLKAKTNYEKTKPEILRKHSGLILDSRG